jgi:hypothetical protein
MRAREKGRETQDVHWIAGDAQSPIFIPLSHSVPQVMSFSKGKIAVRITPVLTGSNGSSSSRLLAQCCDHGLCGMEREERVNRQCNQDIWAEGRRQDSLRIG